MIETAERVTVDLLGGCAEPGCLKMAGEMLMKLDIPKYRDGVSVMTVPASLDEWRSEHRTARKRADRSKRLGYGFGEIDRSQYADDVLAINTSMPERQGRPMAEGYQNPSTGKLPTYDCSRHAIRTYGVLQDERLRAYLTLYRVNELCLVSMILGHGAYLANDIMYELFAGVVEAQAGQGGWFYYNRHSSGTSGLVYFKERLGFQAGDVTWSM